eukprot:TRINITY_DN45957_c0_g1_i1.p1 TRINITY_DN45957_c0_g1~~TRINITY_DN45957_c0_g1_i1.p1  ORF type:complete len:422 (-),score=57.56 TRINITY_DN45957_c0_g1_i1:39-1304(-)
MASHGGMLRSRSASSGGRKRRRRNPAEGQQPPGQLQLALTQAPADRDRDRQGHRSRRGDGRSRRSRSRHHHRSRRGAEAAGVAMHPASSVPPMDWRGPGAAHGPPPTEWRGPGADWRGPPGSHAPPPYWAQPPRPMSMYPPPQHGGPPPHWGAPHASMPPRVDETGRYGSAPPTDWHGPGVPRPGEPPGGPPVDLWRSPPVHGANGWSGGDVSSASAGYPPAASVPAIRNEAEAATEAAGGSGKADVHGSDAMARGPDAGGGDSDGNDVDPEEADDVALAPKTLADRLEGIQLVAGALTQATWARLRAAGIPCGERQSLGGEAAGESAPRKVQPHLDAEDAAALCVKLGLNNVATKRMPPPMPLPPRLPLCTTDVKHCGLWEQFRSRCGTPIPPEASAAPCELRKSRGGGNVLAPSVAAGS